MSGLKENQFGFQFGRGNRVTPDEIDAYRQYIVMHPGTADNSIGTMAAGTVAGTYTIVNTTMDYPRNVLLSVTGGTPGGTAVVYGQDFFGASINESIAVATAAAGGTTAGTKIFARVASASWAPINTNNATTVLGYAIGTSATTQYLFGLPDKIAAVSDVEVVTWINNGTPTALNGGTVGTAIVGTANHTFNGTKVLALTDRFSVIMRSTYNHEQRDFQAKL